MNLACVSFVYVASMVDAQGAELGRYLRPTRPVNDSGATGDTSGWDGDDGDSYGDHFQVQQSGRTGANSLAAARSLQIPHHLQALGRIQSRQDQTCSESWLCKRWSQGKMQELSGDLKKNKNLKER